MSLTARDISGLPGRGADPAPFLGVAQSATGRMWRDRLDERGAAQALAIAQRHDNVPELLARILAGRGVAAEDVPGFLDPTVRALMPDPHTLAGMADAAARIAKETGRPVKLMLDRDQELKNAGTRPSGFIQVKLGATKEGVVTVWDSHHWGTNGVDGSGIGQGVIPYVFNPPNRRRRQTTISINCAPGRAWRAPNHPQGCAITQVAYDDLTTLPMAVLEKSYNSLKEQIDVRDDFLTKRGGMSFFGANGETEAEYE